MTIKFIVMGSEKFAAKQAEKVKRLVPYLRGIMLKQMDQLAQYIKDMKLSGQVLKNQTGTLRRGIHPAVEGEGLIIKGIVSAQGTGPNGGYAKVHERGGDFTIPEHTRLITQAFGRPITPVEATVREHMAHYPPRSFMRTSLAERRDSIIASLRTGARTVLSDT